MSKPYKHEHEWQYVDSLNQGYDASNEVLIKNPDLLVFVCHCGAKKKVEEKDV